MADNKNGPADQDADGKPTYQSSPTSSVPVDRFSWTASHLLNRADSAIYTIIGICFLLAAFCALGYSFWDFGTRFMAAIGKGELGQVAAAIIQFISDLLLILIIMEVLSTIMHYLRARTTSLRPFLFIGIVSATRSILSISARLSLGGPTVPTEEFTHAMIELGVSAAVILALGITLKLLGPLVSELTSD